MNAILLFVFRILLVLISYSFLGWIVYTIFIDLKKATSESGERIISPILFKVKIEDEEITKRFRQEEIVIGRDPSADFPLKHETISLRHSKISYRQKQWWVEDLDSTNGTYLNNDPVKTETILTDGDLLRLGKVELLIDIHQNTSLE